MSPPEMLANNPLWYKDVIIYEARVRSFYDSDEDGIGDFRGLTERLDYLQDLGVNALWLLPFYPSPMRDDGYDISDFRSIHPDCGTLNDFRVFVREAHRRGIRIITELVVNHTSDQHLWFQRARRSPPGSQYRDFYVWSDTPDKYGETRIIFQDFESSNWAWDPVAEAYYWHRFYSNQPDLNYDNPEVRKAILQTIDFWLSMGVDGLRLDAVPYLYEREGTNCENLPETHQFLKDLRRHIDKKFKNRMLLAEANQWPEDAVAYFGDGDECHMEFNFPIMPRMFMAIQMEDRYPVIDILEQTPEVPEPCQWALFLRNHDELTLEMVTDEERDYMYRVYAEDPQMRINLGIRRRLAPLLGNDRNKIELMNCLLFSFPGTPVIYYGDEIGMGDNVYLGDRGGVRTPMQWSGDRNAGFSQTNPQRLILPVITDPEYHFETTNVEVQQNNSHSLLWWMKRIIALRKQFKAFGRGSLEFLHPQNRKVLAFVRRYENELIFVVANLSRFVQYVELDLSEFRGKVPIELFGGTKFPAIGELPYLLTLGPYGFYWFSLVTEGIPEVRFTEPKEALPSISVRGRWDSVFKGKARTALEEALPSFLQKQRWFGGKARRINTVKILDSVPISSHPAILFLTFVRVDYFQGASEVYILTLAYATEERAEAVKMESLRSAIANLETKMKNKLIEGLLYEAAGDVNFGDSFLSLMKTQRRFKGKLGEIGAVPSTAFERLRGAKEELLEARQLGAEQSNSSIVFGERLILKIFRCTQEGVNPDIEVGKFLTERTSFAQIAPVAGHLEYRQRQSQPMPIGILQGYVPNQGDAWQFTLDEVGRFYEHALTREHEVPVSPRKSIFDLMGEEPTELVRQMFGGYLESARLLGRRTAELHVALASEPDDPNFTPEPFTKIYQRSLYQSMRNLTRQTFQLFRDQIHLLEESEQEMGRKILESESSVLQRFQLMRDRRILSKRIRTHGDYHLGQVLCTGKDFVIIDFEGEPARSLNERRLKCSALRDVAGMIGSFRYAVYSPLYVRKHSAKIRPEDIAILDRWADFWYGWVGASFLIEYLEGTEDTVLSLADPDEMALLLKSYLLEKAIYELGYELNNRPDWVRIPMRSIPDLLEYGA